MVNNSREIVVYFLFALNMLGLKTNTVSVHKRRDGYTVNIHEGEFYKYMEVLNDRD